MELLYWLQDLGEHLRVSRRRRALRRPGQGVDHTVGTGTAQRVVSRLHPARMRLRVSDIMEATPTSKTFRLERIDGPLPPFRPGQYVNLFVDVDGVRTSRPYSIASPPGSEVLELTVRDKPGGFVAPYLLSEVRVGDELETTGPAGTFYHEPLIDGQELVFLAGGSGITPFMSILRDSLQPGKDQLRPDIHLLYGSRVPADVIYGQELVELAAIYPNLHYALVVSEPPSGFQGAGHARPCLTGFLSADLIRKQVPDPAGKTYYICGPGAMYDFCLDALAELRVPRHKIKRELYGPPDDVTQEPGWPAGLEAATTFDVHVEAPALDDAETIRAAAGEPLLNSLERYGLEVPALCRAGECSQCRIRLLSGQVFMPARTGLRESDRQHGYIHACVSYPLQDLRIRI
jgi:ferredoxin-NADP reductase